MSAGDWLVLLPVVGYCLWLLLRRKKPRCSGCCAGCQGCGKGRKSRLPE